MRHARLRQRASRRQPATSIAGIKIGIGALDAPGSVVIVGGCGHVGLPLGLAFASRGVSVVLYDLNQLAVDSVNAGILPFAENGADGVLKEVLGRNLSATSDPAAVSDSDVVVVVIGTPIDEHLNPDPTSVTGAIEDLIPYFVRGQLLVLRSTVYPGTTAKVEELLEARGIEVDVSFCPERIAEGRAMTELFELPQIVSARTESAVKRATNLFGILTKTTVQMLPEEAELAKLFTNTWRYIKFATANQLYMMASDYGLDYEKIRRGLALEYPRAADLPGAGFAAGPCLLKDTMQLAAFSNNNFVLGHSAMMINEGLPLYLVSRLEKRYDLGAMNVGILGMAFKEDSDDIRSSLSYKLKRILLFKAKQVLCTDPFVKSDPRLVPLEEVIAKSDLLILATPHQTYLELEVGVPLIDIWSVHSQGTKP